MLVKPASWRYYWSKSHVGDTLLTHDGLIYVGEIYGKQKATRFVMYNVLKVTKSVVTLQNIDNPLSLFETTAQKLTTSGYIRISQTPYIDLQANTGKRRKAVKKHLFKPKRCPLTVDFFEERADSQRPAPILPDLFDVI